MNVSSLVTVLVASLCALVVMAQEPHAALIAGGDARLPELAPQITLDHFSHLWDTAEGLGKNDALARPILVPIVFLDLIMAKLGLSAIFLNHFWPVCIAFIQAFYTIRLFRVLVPAAAPYALTFVGLATLFNPLQVLNYHAPYPATTLAIALTPGLIATALAHLQRPRIATIAEFLGLSIANVVANQNYAIVVTQLVVLALATIATAVASADRRRATIVLMQLMVAYITPNLPIWLPAAQYISGTFRAIFVGAKSYSDSTLVVSSTYSDLWASLRLVGGYLFRNNVGAEPFILEGKSYFANPALVLSSLTLPSLALIGAALGLFERRRWVFIAAEIALVTLFAAKGAAGPGGAIFAWLFTHVKLMHALRDPYSKLSWLLCLSYILLAGYALDSLGKRLRLRWNSFVVAAATAGLIAGAWPILRGDLFWPQARVAIPNRYAETATWFNGHAGRIIEMPVAPNIFDTYAWGYVGAGINYNLVRNPLVAPVFDFDSDANEALDNAFRYVHTGLGDHQAAYILGLYGIRYILFDASINPNFFTEAYSAGIDGPLAHVRLAKRAGSIEIFAVDDGLVNAVVYVPNRLLTGPVDLRELGIACRIMGGCRNVASIGSEIAQRFGQREVSQFRAGPSIRSLPNDAGWARYEIPPITRIASHPARDAARAQSKALELVDYGNRTIAADMRAGALLEFGSAAEIRLRVDPHPGGYSEQFHYIDVLGPRPIVALCPRAGEISWLDIPIGGNQIGRASALLALKYDSKSVSPGVTLFDATNLDPKGNIQNVYQIPLRASRDATWFARLFRLTASQRSAALVLRLSASGESAGGCAHFRSVIVAKGTDRDLSLTHAPRSFDMTPPYVAYHPTIASSLADRLVPVMPAAPQAASLDDKQPTLSDLAPRWSQPEELAPFARTFKYALLQNASAILGVPMLEFDTGQSAYDVHAYFGHLLPGARYRVSFLVKRIVGPQQVQLAALDGDGRPLGLRNIAVRRGQTAPAEISFSLPPRSSSALIYLYGGEPGLRTRTLISAPQLAMIDAAAWPIEFRRAATIPVPANTTVKKISSGEYEVRVKDAPSRYLLVMLATSDPQWHIATPSGITAKRVNVNLYCDGWMLSGPRGDYSMRLYYGDRRWQSVTLATTAMSFLLFVFLTVAITKTWQPDRSS